LARSSDVEDIAAAFRDSAEYHKALDPDLYVVPDTHEMAIAFADKVGSPDSVIFVAEATGHVVGFVEVNLRPPGPGPSMIRPHVAATVGITVRTGHRRQGIGTRLMQAAAEWAVSRGAEALLLDCHVANVGAIRFYERLGYRPQGLIMRRRLEQPSPDLGR
jgi:ribosomal protein S18 acetylase RimI-like enzyme